MDSENIADTVFTHRVIEAGIRIGLLFILVLWCFEIIKPFVRPLLWGIIIAVAVYPLYLSVSRRCGGHQKSTAIALTILGLAILLVPSLLLIGSMVEGASTMASKMQSGEWSIMPPPDRVRDWPLIGESLATFWLHASENLEQTLTEFTPQIKVLGNKLLGLAAGAGYALVEFILSVVIAGFLLVNGNVAKNFCRSLLVKLAPERGAEFADIAEITIRSVAAGILGVAMIQSALVGLGFAVAGVPAAGFWTLVCLVLGVIQIGVLPVVIPVTIYMFSVAESSTAIGLAIWCIIIGPLDNILKPILMGRGARTPLMIVFLGAIGGFIGFGIIGLFLGAVTLSLGHSLLKTWVEKPSQSPELPLPQGPAE